MRPVSVFLLLYLISAGQACWLDIAKSLVAPDAYVECCAKSAGSITHRRLSGDLTDLTDIVLLPRFRIDLDR